MNRVRVMMIAGEPSGDLHGAGVVRELKKLQPDAEVFGIGGEKMQSEGMNLVYHIRELSVMGFWEVVQHLPLLRSVEQTLTALLRIKRPDVVVLIDYPGFNLRFARKAKAQGIKIIYYISPQVWAWNPGRVKTMRGLIDKMLVVFPFETDIYRNAGIDAEFVGHPLLEVLTEPQSRSDFCRRYELESAKSILGLFPGSRKQELERILPSMVGAARILHNRFGVQVAVGVASALEIDFVKSFLRNDFPVKLIHHATYDVMANADVAIVTSGTATLETACYRTPMVVVYRTSPLTYLIGRLLIRIKNIGLVNIVAGRSLVQELIQGKATPQRIADAVGRLIENSEERSRISAELFSVRNLLGSPGASSRVASVIQRYASPNAA